MVDVGGHQCARKKNIQVNNIKIFFFLYIYLHVSCNTLFMCFHIAVNLLYICKGQMEFIFVSSGIITGF